MAAATPGTSPRPTSPRGPPLTAEQADEWLRIWRIEWAAVQRMDRAVAG